MATHDATVTRRRGLWVLASAAVAITTLAGLFAMHGVPMTMPAATSMSEAGAAPAASMRSVAPPSHRSRVSVAALMVGPHIGTHGGRDAEHDGCLAAFRAHVGFPEPA